MTDEIGLFDRLVRSIGESTATDFFVKLVALIVVGLVAKAVWNFWKWLWPRLQSVYLNYSRLQRAQGAVASDGKGMWLATSIPIEPPGDYRRNIRNSIPIISIANLKGGVGKTTIAANLIAHYGIKKEKRVLGIDLDFQGSLTSTALSDATIDGLYQTEAGGTPSKAAHLIDAGDPFYVVHSGETINGVSSARIIPAFYSLATVENRVMVEWLIGSRSGDIRYHLARVLHDPDVQEKFDLIIIDAPPRLTTACIQALCASTHVLIPTVLDELSSDAVGSFCDQLQIHRALWPELKLLGLVASMTELNTLQVGDGALREYELLALRKATDAMADALDMAPPNLKRGTSLPPECFIPQKAELGRSAGKRIAYAAPNSSSVLAEVRASFDRLGDEIDHLVSEK